MLFFNLLKNSLLFGSADFISRLVAFCSYPLIASLLSAKNFGFVELLLTIVTLLGFVINCGLNNSLFRFYWDNKKNKQLKSQLISSGFYAQVFFGLAIIFIYSLFLYFFIKYNFNQNLPLTWITYLSLIIIVVLTQLINYLKDVSRLKFKNFDYFILSVFSKSLGILIGVFALIIGWDTDGLLAGIALGLIIVIPYAFWLNKYDLKINFFNYEQAKRMTSYGYPFIYVGLAFWILGAVDRWMLASMKSLDEVGIYSVAFRFASIVFFVSLAFGQAWSAVAIKIRNDFRKSYRSIYGDVLILLTFIMVIASSSVALFSNEIIEFIMPKEYSQSKLPLIILCLGVFFQSLQQICGIGITIEKKVYLYARISWVIVVLNIILNFLLIPSFGSVGAAISSLICYFIMNFIYFYYTQKLHPIKFSKNIFYGQIVYAMIFIFIALLLFDKTISFNYVAFKIAIILVFICHFWFYIKKILFNLKFDKDKNKNLI